MCVWLMYNFFMSKCQMWLQVMEGILFNLRFLRIFHILLHVWNNITSSSFYKLYSNVIIYGYVSLVFFPGISGFWYEPLIWQNRIVICMQYIIINHNQFIQKWNIMLLWYAFIYYFVEVCFILWYIYKYVYSMYMDIEGF